MMTLRCVGYQLAGALALVDGTFACRCSLDTSGDQLGVEEEPIIDGAGREDLATGIRMTSP